MIRFRYISPARKGRWLPTRRAAEDAAVKAGLGTRDEFPGPMGRAPRFYAHPMVKIEEKDFDAT